MLNKARFLTDVWVAIMQAPSQPVSTWQLHEYVADAVLRPGQLLTVRECAKREMIDDCFKKTVNQLKRDWAKLKPVTKKTLLACIRENDAREFFEDADLGLTESDEQALKIRWHVSDVLYNELRAQAFLRCKQAGLELSLPRGLCEGNSFNDAVREGHLILSELLRTKAQLDKAVVAVAVGAQEEYKYIDQVRGRFKDEFGSILQVFRDALFHLGEYLSPLIFEGVEQRSDLTESQKDGMCLRIQRTLEPFSNEMDGFSETLETVVPGALDRGACLVSSYADTSRSV